MAEVRLEMLAGAIVTVRNLDTGNIAITLSDGDEACEIIMNRNQTQTLVSSLNFVVNMPRNMPNLGQPIDPDEDCAPDYPHAPRHATIGQASGESF